MLKTTLLAARLAFTIAMVGTAAMAPAHVTIGTDGAITQVGEGCGPGRWRGPYGGCNLFNGPGGSNRGTAIECPPGFHISWDRSRCMANR